jgi:hypothetical protein
MMTAAGTVVGFGEKYIERGGFRHKYAGTYIDFEKILIAPSDGSPKRYLDCRSGNNPRPIFASLDKDMSDAYVRIGDLPETPFWEGDTVNTQFHGGVKLIVSSIDYTNRREPAYNLQTETGINACNALQNQLVLLERGKLWDFEHGEPIEFSNIEEEALFHKSLGMSQKIIHRVRIPSDSVVPVTIETEEFSVESALQYIHNGDAHEMKIKDKKNITCVVIKYDDEEFGERMRAHTLAKFGLTEEVPI